MQVHGFIAVGVRNVNHVAVTTFATGEDYAPAADGLHRCADRSAVICTQMRANSFQNGMETGLAEVRSDMSTELQRGMQECLLQGFAVGGVVGGTAFRIMK